jgi:hypothetical protein
MLKNVARTVVFCRLRIERGWSIFEILIFSRSYQVHTSTAPVATVGMIPQWDRNNTILLNLLHALPEGGLETRAIR